MWVGLWLAWWVMVVEGMVQRSSDPNYFESLHSGPVKPVVAPITYDASSLPNVPIGNPESMGTDILGTSLNPDDVMFNDDIGNDPILDLIDDPINTGKWYQGDIIINSEAELALLLDNSTEPAPRSAIVESSKKWPNGVIPYVISKSYDFAERGTIAKAMKIMKDQTKCIRFVPRKSERDYVHILKGDGCSSSVGRVGGAQAMSLGQGCIFKGVVLHEMTHCVGFWHEHSRMDRDSFITIMSNNIITGMEYNFKKYNKFQVQHLAPYDLGSIMHYGGKAFAKDRTRATIRPKNASAIIGQRDGFSEFDIQKIQTLYCPEHLKKNPDSNAITTGACENTSPSCGSWAKRGECLTNPNYMNVHCCIACAEQIQPTDCFDEHEHCASWSRSNECILNSDYMSRKCKKSCKMCHKQKPVVKPGQPCVDTNGYCGAWASGTECQANPGYMKVHCAKSCGAC